MKIFVIKYKTEIFANRYVLFLVIMRYVMDDSIYDCCIQHKRKKILINEPKAEQQHQPQQKKSILFGFFLVEQQHIYNISLRHSI